MNITKRHKSFGGETVFAAHPSKHTKTTMNFSYFRPGGEVNHAILWLSGLTCTEENFITKSGVQAILSDTQTMVVCPDTSPRGLELHGEHDSYDFGSGAGFYLNATTQDYEKHYRMEDYLLDELVPLIKNEFGVSRLSVTGHSMGGHGALTLGLKNPDIFDGISAFSPIVNPCNVPWGQKAFKGYFGEDQDLWTSYDACELVKSGCRHNRAILIDQGLSDEFLDDQLQTESFEKVCRDHGQRLQVNYREGYDHSYYFIATFLHNHVEYLTSF